MDITDRVLAGTKGRLQLKLGLFIEVYTERRKPIRKPEPHPGTLILQTLESRGRKPCSTTMLKAGAQQRGCPIGALVLEGVGITITMALKETGYRKKYFNLTPSALHSPPGASIDTPTGSQRQ